jgi:hypothetical protein
MDVEEIPTKGLDPTYPVGAFRRGGAHPKAATPTPTHSSFTLLHSHSTSLHFTPLTLYSTTLPPHFTPNTSTLLSAPLPLALVHLLLTLCASLLEVSPLLLYKQGRPSPFVSWSLLGRSIHIVSFAI